MPFLQGGAPGHFSLGQQALQRDDGLKRHPTRWKDARSEGAGRVVVKNIHHTQPYRFVS